MMMVVKMMIDEEDEEEKIRGKNKRKKIELVKMINP
jgi:hypothetical protein